jgi:glutathione S-transferase
MVQLYVREGCPFCRKVIEAAQRLGLQEGVDYCLVDAAPDTPGRQTVLAVGGKPMVPFLIDGDHSMYESDDIIDYLRRRFAR